MARLPSERYLVQQIGNDIVIFEDQTEVEIVRYPVADSNAMSIAQKTIFESDLSDEDKTFAHFWCGYFYGANRG